MLHIQAREAVLITLPRGLGQLLIFTPTLMLTLTLTLMC